ncbi:MAG: hypothetical protein U0136_02920 [Bdellovibrionota bacterium]
MQLFDLITVYFALWVFAGGGAEGAARPRSKKCVVTPSKLCFSGVAFCALLHLFAPLMVRAEPERTPRIGLNAEAIGRVRALAADRNSISEESVFLRSLPTMKTVFASRSAAAGQDFKAALGYQYCSKSLTVLATLAAVGDADASATGAKLLLQITTPFAGSGVSSENAKSIALDRSRPYAQRIAALNLLRESGMPVSPSRGDPIYLESSMLETCLALGYDWFSGELSTAQRAIVEKAVKEMLLWSNNIDSEFFAESAPVAQRESNWNAVMNGGSGLLGIAALDSVAGSVAALCSPHRGLRGHGGARRLISWRKSACVRASSVSAITGKRSHRPEPIRKDPPIGFMECNRMPSSPTRSPALWGGTI